MENRIAVKLMIALSYSESSAIRTARDLCAIRHSDLQRGLRLWLDKDMALEITEDKYSTKTLTKEYQMTYPASLIFIDWYRSDPKAALSTLQIRM